MSTTITLEDIRRAWKSKDPELPRLIIDLTKVYERQRMPARKGEKPGALTFAAYWRHMRSWQFRRLSEAEQTHYRVERMKELEAQDPEPPLPERLKTWEVILGLWEANGPYERACLLEIIEKVPLKWGPWRALKRIFKEAEIRGDTEIFGALAARFDESYSAVSNYTEVTRRTIGYLRRRAWRYLRRQAETLPACYVDAAVDVLRFYTITNNWAWRSAWICNHIWYHERGGYSRNGFNLPWKPPSPLKHRAYPELWRRTPRPLFTLLERARAERVREFAVEALKTDFRASLREVEPAWVGRLINVRSQSIDDFVVWLLKNVPRFEQGAFRELSLHEPVLSLLNSQSSAAREYAAAYARTHARDLPLDQLLRLVDNDHKDVQKLALDLIQDRDPRKDIGLEAWGRLLETKNGYELAAKVLRKSFNAGELSTAWFQDRLLSNNKKVFDFAAKLMPKVHAYEKLGAGFFQGLIEDKRVHENSNSRVVNFGFEALSRYPTEQIDTDFLRRALIWNLSSQSLRSWIKKGRIGAQQLGIDFFKSLAYEPDWDVDPWVARLKSSGLPWAEDLSFDQNLSQFAFELLGDGRLFTPRELGFDWLMKLAEHAEPRYHEFGVETMIRSFAPADFAQSESDDPEATTREGCERLWAMATEGEEETLLSRFATSYLRRHHPELARKLQDRPVKPGAEIPASFLTFERVRPLLISDQRHHRQLALEFARWEFARWSPPMDDIVALCESPHDDIFDFVSEALLAEDSEDTKRYRLDPSVLSADAVYQFCESLDKGARALGMKLIKRESKLADPIELFRLSESPDRQVRAFVIRTIWSLYRDRGITIHWTPPPTDKAQIKALEARTAEKKQKTRKPVAKKKKKVALDLPSPAGPRPDRWPAEHEALKHFLRRILFTVAPARLPKADRAQGKGVRLKPLPARKAKLSLIEVIRDLAIEDAGFALLVSPLLEEFMSSRGKSEHDACLVALTRIEKAHGSLSAREEA